MKKQEASDLTTRPLSRREFLSLAAWAGVLVSGLAALGKGLRFLQPAVTYGPATVYSVGSPADFPPGSRRLLQRERVLIARDERGFRALSAVCTHLGCTVTLMEWGFSCPCHGRQQVRLGGRELCWASAAPAALFSAHAVTGRSVSCGYTPDRTAR